MREFDTIIVGGGSAGCALAHRLSADPDHRVLVLEAGRPDSSWDLFIHMPAGFSTPIGNRRYDWCYVSEPEPGLGGRRVAHARGKVLGGSSSINGMIFVRGNRCDFDRWGDAPGMGKWDYEHCLPYFQRSETADGGDPRFRGTDGPLVLERGPCEHPLNQAFFGAMAEAGHRRSDDLNGRQQEGFGPFDRNIQAGIRLSAARAYLHPVLSRPNLTAQVRTLTHRVLFEGRTAVGVEVSCNGVLETIRAHRVVCCAGAINSPQLLQLSGIGPAALLQGLDIDVVADLPGVGANLQDHLEVYIQRKCKQPISLAPALKWWNQPAIGLEWLLRKTGAASSNHFEAGAFFRTDSSVGFPNVQLHFLPLAIRYDGTMPAEGHGYQIHAGPTLSDATGSVHIRSADPTVHPALRFNYLTTEQDRREWVQVIHQVREILFQPSFAPFDGGALSPGPDVRTDAEILAWVQRDAETALHPSCTCRLGVDPMAVVHPDTMAVHGVENLYVVDTSVMPSITNGNLYAPTMMIAEKAADLLIGAPPLPPSRTPPPTQESRP